MTEKSCPRRHKSSKGALGLLRPDVLVLFDPGSLANQVAAAALSICIDSEPCAQVHAWPSAHRNAFRRRISQTEEILLTVQGLSQQGRWGLSDPCVST